MRNPVSRALSAAALAFAVASGAVVFAASGPDSASAQDQLAPEERLKRNQVSAESGIGDGEFQAQQQKGIGGDREAAFKVAQMFKAGSNGVPRDDKRMVQWLLHASSLNNGAASYQLYQYYLDQRLDRDAIFFENRALEQGFTPPPRLDPRRG